MEEILAKILITGAAGFIGLSLAKALLKLKNKIYLLDNLSRGKIDQNFKALLKLKDVKFIKKDLTKNLNFNLKFDYIFHLASVVGVNNVNKNPFNTLKNNLISTINLINSVRDQKKTRFILFSTSEVYSSSIKNYQKFKPSSELNDLIIKSQTKPRDSYYLSKIMSEKILVLSGIKYLILRPHNIYGPRMGYSHVIPELINRIKTRKKCKVFSPNHTRSFCYIDDAINQIISLSISNKFYNSIYNIGNMNEEIKIFNLAKKIKNIVNKNCKLVKGKNTPGSPIRRIPNMKKTLRKVKQIKYKDLNRGLNQTAIWYLNN